MGYILLVRRKRVTMDIIEMNSGFLNFLNDVNDEPIKSQTTKMFDIPNKINIPL